MHAVQNIYRKTLADSQRWQVASFQVRISTASFRVQRSLASRAVSLRTTRGCWDRSRGPWSICRPGWTRCRSCGETRSGKSAVACRCQSWNRAWARWVKGWQSQGILFGFTCYLDLSIYIFCYSLFGIKGQYICCMHIYISVPFRILFVTQIKWSFDIIIWACSIDLCFFHDQKSQQDVCFWKWDDRLTYSFMHVGSIFAFSRQKKYVCLDKSFFWSVWSAFHQVVEWVSGPAEKLLASQTDIGDSYKTAEELRKQHEQLELKCTVCIIWCSTNYFAAIEKLAPALE